VEGIAAGGETLWNGHVRRMSKKNRTEGFPSGYPHTGFWEEARNEQRTGKCQDHDQTYQEQLNIRPGPARLKKRKKKGGRKAKVTKQRLKVPTARDSPPSFKRQRKGRIEVTGRVPIAAHQKGKGKRPRKKGKEPPHIEAELLKN